MQTIHFISILLHVLAAIVWIGGMAFLGLVLVPVLRDSSLRAQAVQLLSGTGLRFRTVGWVCLALLIATGIVNLTRWGVGLERLTSAELWGTTWGRILAVKLVLVAAALVMSLVHDFFVGPRAAKRLREERGSAEARRSRRLAAWMGRTNLLISIAIVAVAIMLVRGLPA